MLGSLIRFKVDCLIKLYWALWEVLAGPVRSWGTTKTWSHKDVDTEQPSPLQDYFPRFKCNRVQRNPSRTTPWNCKSATKMVEVW